MFLTDDPGPRRNFRECGDARFEKSAADGIVTAASGAYKRATPS
jgi:hypothetical protein